MSSAIIVSGARELVNYIERLESFKTVNLINKPFYKHIGALFVDIILQAGLNYKNIVEPRVIAVMNNYPNADTVSRFSKLIEGLELSYIIRWKHPVKLQRIANIVLFCSNNNIETCYDFREFLSIKFNRDLILSQNGFGLKTLDYTLKLLSFDTVAVDRHITAFVKNAGITVNDYDSTKKIVEYAADLMDISRSSFDYSIWRYMSKPKAENNLVLSA